MVTGNEDVVIGNRFGKQVRNYLFRFEPNLRAAEIGLVLIANQLYIFGKNTFKVAAYFDERIVAKRKICVNGYSREEWCIPF